MSLGPAPPPPPLAMVREWSLFMPEVSTEEKRLANFLFEQMLWLGEVFSIQNL